MKNQTQKIYKARIECKLKSGILDPEGKAILCTLEELSTKKASAKNIARSKIFIIDILSNNKENALAQATHWSKELLVNTIIEDFQIEIS